MLGISLSTPESFNLADSYFNSFSNLSWTSTDDTLRMAFGEYGQVLDAVCLPLGYLIGVVLISSTQTVMRDFLTGISKGYGYVTFVNGEEAQAAIDGLNNQEYDP